MLFVIEKTRQQVVTTKFFQFVLDSRQSRQNYNKLCNLCSLLLFLVTQICDFTKCHTRLDSIMFINNYLSLRELMVQLSLSTFFVKYVKKTTRSLTQTKYQCMSLMYQYNLYLTKEYIKYTRLQTTLHACMLLLEYLGCKIRFLGI